jgi:hypothetical protein
VTDACVSGHRQLILDDPRAILRVWMTQIWISCGLRFSKQLRFKIRWDEVSKWRPL